MDDLVQHARNAGVFADQIAAALRAGDNTRARASIRALQREISVMRWAYRLRPIASLLRALRAVCGYWRRA